MIDKTIRNVDLESDVALLPFVSRLQRYSQYVYLLQVYPLQSGANIVMWGETHDGTFESFTYACGPISFTVAPHAGDAERNAHLPRSKRLGDRVEEVLSRIDIPSYIDDMLRKADPAIDSTLPISYETFHSVVSIALSIGSGCRAMLGQASAERVIVFSKYGAIDTGTQNGSGDHQFVWEKVSQLLHLGGIDKLPQRTFAGGVALLE